ncbi:Alpha_L_fucos-domain-containing protein, partial [Fragilariopsis cylindrus CCMP1102]
TWESLDKREIPKWFGSGKVGIFIHWGVFSVPAFKSEWFWYNWQQGGAKHHQQEYIDFVDRTEKKGFAYSEYASRFDATFYEPDYWAEIFAQSGAQYVVLTSKHHEGFCNWDSREIGTTYMWNSMEKGPKRDLVGELAKAIRNPKVKSIQTNNQLKFGVYHSLLEWYNPLLKHDINNNLTNSNCKHGSFLNCHDRYLPNRTNEHKWENAMTLDKNSWGWNRKAKISDYLTTKELIDEMVTTVARNGNILINVGPAADGTISPIFVDRLLGLGDWLKVNGQAIYNTQSWKICDQDLNDHTVYYTRDDTLLYAHLTQWPLDNQLHLHCPEASNNTRAFILGVQHADESDSDGIISVIGTDHSHKDKDPTIPPVRILSSHSRQRKEEGVGGVTIQLPYMNPSQLPCQHVWVVAMTAIDNLD